MTYANPHLLWSVDELRDHLQDPNLVLLDMRPPEVYSNGHIPGARSFDIFGISLIDTRPEPLEAFLWRFETGRIRMRLALSVIALLRTLEWARRCIRSNCSAAFSLQL